MKNLLKNILFVMVLLVGASVNAASKVQKTTDLDRKQPQTAGLTSGLSSAQGFGVAGKARAASSTARPTSQGVQPFVRDIEALETKSDAAKLAKELGRKAREEIKTTAEKTEFFNFVEQKKQELAQQIASGADPQKAQEVLNSLNEVEKILFDKSLTTKQKAIAIAGTVAGTAITIAGTTLSSYLSDRLNAWSGESPTTPATTDEEETDVTTGKTKKDLERIDIDLDMTEISMPKIDDLKTTITKVSSVPLSVISTSNLTLNMMTTSIVEQAKQVLEDALTLADDATSFDAKAVAEQIITDIEPFSTQIDDFIANTNNLIVDTALPGVTVPKLIAMKNSLVTNLQDGFNDAINAQFVKVVAPLQKKINKTTLTKVMKAVSDKLVEVCEEAGAKIEKQYKKLEQQAPETDVE